MPVLPGYGVGDILTVLKLVNDVYTACKDGPGEYEEICRETMSLRLTLNSLSNDARNTRSLLNTKGTRRRQDLQTIIRNCEGAVKELQALVDKHSSLETDGVTRIWHAYQMGSADTDGIRGKLIMHTSIINAFLQSLQGSALTRIEKRIDKIYVKLRDLDASQARQSTTSLASTVLFIENNEEDTWKVLEMELLKEDISGTHILEHKDEIIKYITRLVEADPSPLLPTMCARTTNHSTYGGPSGQSSPTSANLRTLFKRTKTALAGIVLGFEPDNESLGTILAGDRGPAALYRPVARQALTVWNLAHDLYEAGRSVRGAPTSFAKLLEDIKEFKEILGEMQAQFKRKRISEDVWTERALSKCAEAILLFAPLVGKYQGPESNENQRGLWLKRIPLPWDYEIEKCHKEFKGAIVLLRLPLASPTSDLEGLDDSDDPVQRPPPLPPRHDITQVEQRGSNSNLWISGEVGDRSTEYLPPLPHFGTLQVKDFQGDGEWCEPNMAHAQDDKDLYESSIVHDQDDRDLYEPSIVHDDDDRGLYESSIVYDQDDSDLYESSIVPGHRAGDQKTKTKLGVLEV
jgi:hypothetical protein